MTSHPDIAARLSNRIRPDCEAAPWVVAEVKKLEDAIESRDREIAELRNRNIELENTIAPCRACEMDDPDEGCQCFDKIAVHDDLVLSRKLQKLIEALRAENSKEYLRGRKDEQAAKLDADHSWKVEADTLRASLQAAEQGVGNLLAVIHRDGGHYQLEHGTQKACEDACVLVNGLRGALQFESDQSDRMDVLRGELVAKANADKEAAEQRCARLVKLLSTVRKTCNDARYALSIRIADIGDALAASPPAEEK